MNCFQKVQAALGLNGNMQDDGSDVAYLVVAALADKEAAYEAALIASGGTVPSDTYPNNPFKEVLYRLQPYQGFGYKYVARCFGARAT
jgi:hypothetical protein